VYRHQASQGHGNDRTLVIGNKNYSSWSLGRGSALKLGRVEFERPRIALDQPQTSPRSLRSPSGKVPCLIDGPLVVWDSLRDLRNSERAICRGHTVAEMPTRAPERVR